MKRVAGRKNGWTVAFFAGVAILMSTALSPAAAQTEITLRTSWSPYAPHIPFYLAQAKGWFEEEGLAVTIEDSKGSAIAINLVGAGQSDIAFASLDTMAIARAKGVPVKAISSIVRKNEFGVAFDKGKPYRDPADLAGTELIYTAGSVEALLIDKFLAAGDLTRQDAELVAVDAAAKYSMFASGEGDGVVGSVPFVKAAMAGVRDADALLFADFGSPMLAAGIVANEDVISDKPEGLKAFNEVVARSWAYILEDEAHVTEACQAMSDLRPDAKVDVDSCVNVFDAYRPFVFSEGTQGKPIGYQAPDDWNDTVTTLKQLGLIPDSVTATEFYTTEFQPEG